MGSSCRSDFQVKKVAIVGAGPCGLAAAKYLTAQAAFDSIVIFEQQDEVGGVWNYSDLAPGPCAVPQTDAFVPPEPPVRSPAHGQKAPIFPSAMYDRLHANIPGVVMNFSHQSFPKESWLFPSRRDIRAYILRYAEDVRALVRLCFQVNKITPVPGNGQERWRLEALSTVGDEVIDDTFDAVVVASGHYSVPFIPDIKNMKPFHEAHPSVISHSKQYRRAAAFNNKRVIIVGNGPSGLDIALQISHASRGKTLLSVRTATPPAKLAHTGCEEVTEIEEFLVEQRGVRLRDGRVETDIDAIVFCTGFLFSYPFLPDLQHELITTGLGVHGLYKHLFCIRHPTLVFSSLPTRSVPWPVSEAQAAVFAAVWSNNLQLPPVEEMERWSRELYESQGEALHVFQPLAEGSYINEFHDWAAKAKHPAKKPPRWNDERFWQRSVCVEAKLRFEQQGCQATTLEELGLYYDADRTSEL